MSKVKIENLRLLSLIILALSLPLLDASAAPQCTIRDKDVLELQYFEESELIAEYCLADRQFRLSEATAGAMGMAICSDYMTMISRVLRKDYGVVPNCPEAPKPVVTVVPDTPPEVARFTSIYPSLAKERGIEGGCETTLTIDSRGRASNFSSVCSDDRFLREAERALSRAAFVPRRLNGETVDKEVIKVAVGYSLGQDPSVEIIETEFD